MPIKTERVLRDEAKEIHPNANLSSDLTGANLYIELNKLGSAALCLSGGGIRSAAFALGVIQALAVPRPAGVAEKPAQSLLTKFHYISTVSGGGYIGSWLFAWLSSRPLHEVWQNIRRRPGGPDVEPPELKWLRSYTNYLTPRIGITSPDMWAAIALILRNLILNWLVILPMVCALILFLKIFGLLSTWIIVWGKPDGWMLSDAWDSEIWVKLILEIGSGFLAITLLISALAWTVRNQPTSRSKEDPGPTQGQFLRVGMVLSIFSALLLVQLLASDLAGNLLMECDDRSLTIWTICAVHKFHKWPWLHQIVVNQSRYSWYIYVCNGGILGTLVYALGPIFAGLPAQDWRGFLAWAVSGAAYGSIVGLGLFFYVVIPDEGIGLIPEPFLHIVFGIPWVLMSQLAANIAYIGVSTYKTGSDADREWLGRASGWLIAAALVWLIVTFLIFFGSRAVPTPAVLEFLRTALPVAGAISGGVTAAFGKSSYLPAIGYPERLRQHVASLTLTLAGAIFIATLLIGLSYAIDALLFGMSLLRQLGNNPHEWSANAPWMIGRLGIGFVISLMIGIAASSFININRVSLHALYRNRLIRAFLGAARHIARKPDSFSGFDLSDNLRMTELWSPVEGETWRPFPVINAAVNIVSTERLEWQERKSEPFTFSPLYSGSSFLGYLDTKTYGGKDGISLGTAMAISGAAANPNMGYSASPTISFLMSLFNVRLGWWLPNPNRPLNQNYEKEGPPFAFKALVQEALGLTSDKRDFICLSDGGHFDNLGLYEMVRRRCRFIVVSDASCDRHFGLHDLGNALRRIRIDLGVLIRFYGLEGLVERADDGGVPEFNHDYYGIGEIDYPAADGGGDIGLILYLKPCYYGVEGAAIRDYAATNLDFPHESTVHQWFTESQFEAYRELGFEITDFTLRRAFTDAECGNRSTLKNVLETLRNTLRYRSAVKARPSTRIGAALEMEDHQHVPDPT